MPGAARFLYGLALGVCLGVIGARLFAASSARRPQAARVFPPAAPPRPKRPRQEALTR